MATSPSPEADNIRTRRKFSASGKNPYIRARCTDGTKDRVNRARRAIGQSESAILTSALLEWFANHPDAASKLEAIKGARAGGFIIDPPKQTKAKRRLAPVLSLTPQPVPAIPASA